MAMTDPHSNPQPIRNTLGNASLVLGILGSVSVVCIGLCAGAGQQQGWLNAVATLLAILGGTSAFMGLLAGILGFLGLFGRNRSRATAIAGIILGLFAITLFAAIVQSAQ